MEGCWDWGVLRIFDECKAKFTIFDDFKNVFFENLNDLKKAEKTKQNRR